MAWHLRCRNRGIFLLCLASMLISAAGRSQDKSNPAQPPVAPPSFSPNTVIPLTFPVLGKVDWSNTFNPDDATHGRIHHGEDLMAAKMTPLVAAFDGRVFVNSRPGHNMLSIAGDNGYFCLYCHINDDTPGTHDHKGTADYAYAPGLKSGDHVIAGQLVAWVGDSGNARGGPPHCHFELTGREGYYNPAPSLRAARRLTKPVFDVTQPQLKPEKGEVRLDGVVRSFDGNKTLVIRALASTTPGHHIVAAVKPTRRWVTLQPDTVLRRRDAPDQSLTAAEIKPDLPIIVIGKDRGDGKAILARLAAADLPSAVQIAALDADKTDREKSFPETPSGNVPPPVQRRNNARLRSTIPAAPPRTLTNSETHLLELLNAFRRENRLPSLIPDARLSDAAWKHSLDMANAGYYGHVGSDGSTLTVRLNLAAYVSMDAAENLAVNIATEEGVVDTWLAQGSKARINLLNPAFRQIGLGCARVGGRQPGSARGTCLDMRTGRSLKLLCAAERGGRRDSYNNAGFSGTRAVERTSLAYPREHFHLRHHFQHCGNTE